MTTFLIKLIPEPCLRTHSAKMSTTTLSTSELYSEEDSALIHKLLNISKVNPKLIRSSTYQVSEDPAIQVRSWRMSEFRYYDIPSPFPTLARGLFTTEVTSADSADDRYRIVARGYDKFYNIGEVPWTTVRIRLVPPPKSITPIPTICTPRYLVAGYQSLYNCPLPALGQGQRMYHLHRRANSHQTAVLLQALHWPRAGFRAEPCPGGRTMDEEIPRAKREDRS